MARSSKKRRQSHGSAWHWKQTDCWYATLPGAKKRVPLWDEAGNRIRGKENREAAAIALARQRLKWELSDSAPGGVTAPNEWIVARVCSDYLQDCERRFAKGTVSRTHRDNAKLWLNDLCAYCGATPVQQLKKGHIQQWIDSHATWRSTETHRGVLAIVLAAFNRAQDLFDMPNPLRGMKKPAPKPRLTSISPEDEQTLYAGCESKFREFLFAAIHTGLRPFSELALLTADHVEEHPRGMMWRVYATKTKKTRKIPVRPEVAELVRKLMKSAPAGSGIPLFRNTKGNPWKRTNGVVRFIDLRKKLGWESDPVRSKYSCYACRHTFAHRMLSGHWTAGQGCSIETLAELLGDTPKVAFAHYGKEWGQHYQAPLWAAIGESAPPAATATPRKRVKSPQVVPARGKQAKQRRSSKPTGGRRG